MNKYEIRIFRYARDRADGGRDVRTGRCRLITNSPLLGRKALGGGIGFGLAAGLAGYRSGPRRFACRRRCSP